MLVSMNENKIRLMDIESGEVVESYEGHVQSKFIIRSAFGGAGEGFVVSGSEGMFSLFSFSILSLLFSLP
jgi:hypothetical protein